MTRYFLHLRDGTEQILDPEGLEFATIEAVRKAVLVSARDLMTGDIREGVIDLRFRSTSRPRAARSSTPSPSSTR